MINNYLFQAGNARKYSIQIEVATLASDKLMALFKLCPHFSNNNMTTKFWVPLESKILKLGRKQDDVYSSEEIASADDILEFPDILDGRNTSQELTKGDLLPNVNAGSLERFSTVIAKFNLKSWMVGTGGITTVLQEVILIDKDMRPKSLQRSLDTAMLASPSKRRKVIV